MKKYLLALSLILGSYHITQAKEDMTIKCHVFNNDEVIYMIEGNKVSLIKETFTFDSNRHLSSVKGTEQSKTTHKSYGENGFIKTAYFNGKKHRIYIKSPGQFDIVEDLVKISSVKGEEHTVTYPLNCQYLTASK